MSSFRDINYTLRPSKSVERKMILEVIRKFSVFKSISEFQYIGFGSIYFSDFILFHRNLGLTKMTTIESQVTALKRVNFNKPFSCIKVEMGQSNAVLPKLNWKQNSIVWLDYDGKLNSSMLTDLNTVCKNAELPSFVCITVNIQPDSPSNEVSLTAKEKHEFRLAVFKERVGDDKVKPSITGKDLTLSGIESVNYNIITNEIKEAIKTINIGRPEDPVEFKQLINIIYKDGAQMLTIGGLILNQENKVNYEKAEFDKLPFVREANQSYEIITPNLTFKEVGYLDSRIHEIYDNDTNTLTDEGLAELKDFIVEADAKNYIKIYRYYPTFAEALL